MAREYDKLIRDRIPEIIRENDEKPTTYIADDSEYSRRLVEKLEEEVEEYCESREVEELADILEVIHAIRKDHDITVEELRKKREEKAEQRGRFDEGIILQRVEE